MLVCWYAGMLVCLLVCWYAGMLVCWYAGMLVCWYAGMLVCWYAGMLVCSVQCAVCSVQCAVCRSVADMLLLVLLLVCCWCVAGVLLVCYWWLIVVWWWCADVCPHGWVCVLLSGWLGWWWLVAYWAFMLGILNVLKWLLVVRVAGGWAEVRGRPILQDAQSIIKQICLTEECKCVAEGRVGKPHACYSRIPVVNSKYCKLFFAEHFSYPENSLAFHMSNVELYT